MKQLAVFLMIPALALFMVPALASAEDGLAIQGTYAMSASGSCLHSEREYFQNADRNNWWTVPNGSHVYAGVTVANGTWIFKNDGTGTYSQTIYATILPGGHVPVPVIPVEVRVLAAKNVAFHYVITASGDITVTQDNNGIQSSGSISNDKKTMTLLTANNVQHLADPFWYTICNTARILIKVDE
jgi:hypothetical protein